MRVLGASLSSCKFKLNMFRFNTPDRGISRRGGLYLNEIHFACLYLYRHEKWIFCGFWMRCVLFSGEWEVLPYYRLCRRGLDADENNCNETQLHFQRGDEPFHSVESLWSVVTWKQFWSICVLMQHVVFLYKRKVDANCCEIVFWCLLARDYIKSSFVLTPKRIRYLSILYSIESSRYIMLSTEPNLRIQMQKKTPKSQEQLW